MDCGNEKMRFLLPKYALVLKHAVPTVFYLDFLLETDLLLEAAHRIL